MTDETVSEHNEAIPLHLSAVCFGHIITGKKRSGSGSLLHERCCFVSFADQLLEDICRHVHRRQTAYLLIELDRLDPGAYPGACGSLKVAIICCTSGCRAGQSCALSLTVILEITQIAADKRRRHRRTACRLQIRTPSACLLRSCQAATVHWPRG